VARHQNPTTLSVLSSAALTMRQLSACRQRMTPVWPSCCIQSSVLSQRPERTSQNLMVQSRLPDTMRLASNCRHVTAFWCALCSVSTHCPLARSHTCFAHAHSRGQAQAQQLPTLIVLSADPDTILRSSNCRHSTASSWPLSTLLEHDQLFYRTPLVTGTSTGTGPWSGPRS